MIEFSKAAYLPGYETMTSFYRIEPARFGSIGAAKSVSNVFHLKTLIGFLTIVSFTAIALPSVAFAADAVSTPANTTDGWESPSKLKPYVKLQPDGSAAPSGTSSTGTSTTGTPTGITVKKETVQITTPTDATTKEIDSVVKSIILDGGPDMLRLRKDRKAAKRLAKYHWLDKSADANPSIIEAITMHRSAAKILANHPRLSQIAEADHYTCRRIAKYKAAARVLAANGDVKEVAALDPEGLYAAIKRDRKIIRILSRNPIFDQMIVENPDLARVISKYM